MIYIYPDCLGWEHFIIKTCYWHGVILPLTVGFCLIVFPRFIQGGVFQSDVAKRLWNRLKPVVRPAGHVMYHPVWEGSLELGMQGEAQALSVGSECMLTRETLQLAVSQRVCKCLYPFSPQNDFLVFKTRIGTTFEAQTKAWWEKWGRQWLSSTENSSSLFIRSFM